MSDSTDFTKLMPGFDLVADELDLHDLGVDCDLVITGEGFLDEQSFEGKVIGGVQSICEGAGKPVVAIVGDSDEALAARIEHVSLTREFGLDRAMREPLWCIEQAALQLLRDR